MLRKHFRNIGRFHVESKRLERDFKKQKEKYDREHEAELIHWKAANRLLHAKVPDMKEILVNQWKAEYTRLAARVNELSVSLIEPKAELQAMEKIWKMIDYVQKERTHEQGITEQKDRQKAWVKDCCLSLHIFIGSGRR